MPLESSKSKRREEKTTQKNSSKQDPITVGKFSNFRENRPRKEDKFPKITGIVRNVLEIARGQNKGKEITGENKSKYNCLKLSKTEVLRKFRQNKIRIGDNLLKSHLVTPKHLKSRQQTRKGKETVQKQFQNTKGSKREIFQNTRTQREKSFRNSARTRSKRGINF